MVNPPDLTTLGLPLTGAARNSVPRATAAARTCAEVSVETVEQSTTIFGAWSGFDSTPWGPVVTSSRSSLADTMMKTMSRSARSAGWSTTRAPSASALAFVRFWTVTSLPAAMRRAAMAAPMRPAPIQPMVVSLIG